MTNMGISDFVANVSRWGLANPNRYEVMFSLPTGSESFTNIYPSAATQSTLQYLGTSNMAKSLSMRCSAMTFPGRGIQTLDDKQYGTTKKVPYGTDYNAVDFSFIASKDLFERVFFEGWQNLVLNPVSNTVSFWDEYVADVEMSQLDSETGEPTYTVKLKSAYPISVNSVDYGYDKTNELQLVTVSMIYKYWVNTFPLEQDVYAI